MLAYWAHNTSFEQHWSRQCFISWISTWQFRNPCITVRYKTEDHWSKKHFFPSYFLHLILPLHPLDPKFYASRSVDTKVCSCHDLSITNVPQGQGEGMKRIGRTETIFLVNMSLWQLNSEMSTALNRTSIFQWRLLQSFTNKSRSQETLWQRQPGKGVLFASGWLPSLPNSSIDKQASSRL